MVDYKTILAFLGGSIGTFIYKEIMNQINKHLDFNRDLKKHTYTKKLEKAENAIAFYWTYLSKVTEMKKSLEFIIKAVNEIDEKDNDIGIIQDLMKKNGLALTELAGEKYSSINAVHLYFDLKEDDKWNENDIGLMLSSLSETKSIDNEIMFWNDLYENANKNNDEANADFYWSKSLELLPTYVSSLQNYIDTLEKNKIATLSMIEQIKKQLRKY